MTTLLASIVLITVIVGISLIMVLVNKRYQPRQKNKTLVRFQDAGIANNLSFSSQQELKDCVIGLDGVHRKLLVLQQAEGKYGSLHVVDLDEVKKCAVKKVYRNTSTSSGDRKNIEGTPDKIMLRFEFSNDRKPVEIPFYDQRNHLSDRRQELEQKARDWETILSKMIKNDLRKIA
jgi:hypothetical protein